MYEEKPFLTIEEQIRKLQNRNLIIDDIPQAKRYLELYGYYEIINGYKDNYLNNAQNDDEGFKKDASFENIFHLFQMDMYLRSNILELLGAYETYLKQSVAYVISENISDKQEIYMSAANYKAGKYDETHQNYERDYVITQLKEAAKSKSQPFKHYRTIHGNIPPWIAVKYLTFGTITTWVSLLPPDLKNKVMARMLKLPDGLLNDEIKQFFGESMNLYRKFRNRAAHGGRIYNYRIQNGFSSTQYAKLTFDMSKTAWKKGRGRTSIGAVLRSIQAFDNDEFNEYVFRKTTSIIDRFLYLHPNDREFIFAETDLDDIWLNNWRTIPMV